jgi:hypothetical protein
MIAGRGIEQSANDSNTNGWIVGHMQAGLGKTSSCEVKLWRYDATLDYPKKTFSGPELIVVYGGVIRLELEKDGLVDYVVISGDDHGYVLIEPDTIKKVVVVQAPAFGVTVRWPSVPGASKVISDDYEAGN